MKIVTLLIMCMILCLAVMAWAGRAELAKDGKSTKLEGHAPTAGKGQILTIASTTIDMSDDISWGLYTPTDCSYRTMSTSTRSGIQKTIPAGAWHVRVVSAGSAFTNFSGCTAAQLERQ